MRRQLFIERLETRRVFATLGATNTAVLDFDGESMNDEEIREAWRFWDSSDFKDVENGTVTFPSFHTLFTSDREQLDISGDGTTNSDDATLAIDMIVAKVRQDFASYDLDIVVGDQDDHRDMFRDDVLGDSLVIIAGGIDNTSFRSTPAGGWAGYDEGNESDGLALAFTGSRAHFSVSRLVNSVAKTISHELGHSFGLRHHRADPTGATDPITHSIMIAGGSDTTRDFSFHNRSYDTERGGEDRDPQNAHEILSTARVLGLSDDPWMTVLEPGVLTVHGSGAADTISVGSVEADSWNVRLAGANTQVDVNSVDRSSLNPFEQALDVIELRSDDGDDVIEVDGSIIVNVFANGGDGNDTLQLTGSDAHVDLTSTADTKLQSIEVFDITGSGDNILTLDASEVLNTSPVTKTLTVIANRGDAVNIGNGWTLIGTEIDHGKFVRVLSQSATLRLIGPSDWTTPRDPLDVNASGEISPIDALQVINELTEPKFSADGTLVDAASINEFPNRFFDVTADGFVSPLDALRVINFINDALQSDGEAEPIAADTNLVNARVPAFTPHLDKSVSTGYSALSREATIERPVISVAAFLANSQRSHSLPIANVESQDGQPISRRSLRRALTLDEFTGSVDELLAKDWIVVVGGRGGPSGPV